MKKKPMTENEAFDIVLDLASQNFCDEKEMPNEYARQNEAYDIVSTVRKDLQLIAQNNS
jgi:hypothetical protein